MSAPTPAPLQPSLTTGSAPENGAAGPPPRRAPARKKAPFFSLRPAFDKILSFRRLCLPAGSCARGLQGAFLLAKEYLIMLACADDCVANPTPGVQRCKISSPLARRQKSPFGARCSAPDFSPRFYFP